MKARDIQPGKRYAVRCRLPKAAGMPAIAPIRYVDVVDKNGSTIVCIYDGFKPTAVLDPNRISTVAERKYAPAKITMTVNDGDVVCLAEDYPAYRAHDFDARIDRPVRKVGGDGHVTFQEQTPAPPWRDHDCAFKSKPRLSRAH